MNQEKLTEIIIGYEGGLGEVQVYVNVKTGETVWDAELVCGEPCPVEDMKCHEDYIPLQTKYDLNLGQPLVWDFVYQEILEAEDTIRGFFRRKGAYRRFDRLVTTPGSPG